MKELTLEEVLRIAGGVPLAAALDELTYRAPTEEAAGPADRARLLGRGPSAPWGSPQDPPSSETV